MLEAAVGLYKKAKQNETKPVNKSERQYSDGICNENKKKSMDISMILMKGKKKMETE